VHHRDTLNATKILAERTLANPKVSVVWNTDVISINGDTAVDNLTVRDAVTGQESTMEGVSGIFIAIGHVPRTGPVADQVALDSHGYIVVDHPSTRTNLPGVYAAGDVVDPTYRQAITAAGMGCTAALDVQHYLEENPS
ncbi:MAG: FAD-dependent oxidoreductase, partial [Cellulomonadaceae bacterium]|nr:FAD-dependent oxidoreductase [Cellulomonadaceae bacterium]